MVAQSTDSSTLSFFLLHITTGTLTQIITFTQARLFRSPLVLSANGTRVAFAATANPTGENADGNLEIFLFDAPTGTVNQVTKTTAGGSFPPAINADGTRLAFISAADLTGSNPDGNDEIFLFDVPSDIMTQITNTQTTSTTRIFSGNSASSIDADGTRISFVSDIDLTGGNPDGNSELFLFDTRTNTLSQITDLQSTETVAANIFTQTISGNGNRIVFETTADMTGQNSDGSFELFLFDIRTDTFTQITNLIEGFFDFPLAISADGTRIAFALEKVGSPFNSEIFLFNTRTGTLTQVTESGEGASFSPSMSADGTRIAFGFAPKVILVGADLLGYNPANPVTTSDSSGGIFLATCAGR